MAARRLYDQPTHVAEIPEMGPKLNLQDLSTLVAETAPFGSFPPKRPHCFFRSQGCTTWFETLVTPGPLITKLERH